MDQTKPKTKNSDYGKCEEFNAAKIEAEFSEQGIGRDKFPAPDGGFGWVIVFMVFLIHLVMDGITYSFGVLLSELLDTFNSSKFETSWIMSVLIGTTFGCGPLPSAVSNRFGRRFTAVAGGFLACLGTFSSSFATAVWQMILSFGLLTGFGCGFLYLPAVVSVNYWFDKRRSMAVGIAVCGSGLGMMVFNPFTRYLLDSYGVPGCLILYAGIFLNCCVFAAFLRPTPGEDRLTKTVKSLLAANDTVTHQELKELVPKSAARSTTPDAIMQHLMQNIDMDLMRQWRFWVFCLSAFFCGISSYMPYAFVPHRAETEADISRENTAYLMAVMGFANMGGRLASSFISDRPWQNRTIVYSCMWLAAGLATSLSVFCATYDAFMAYSVIFGFTLGYITALQSVVLTDIVGLEKLSSAFGVLLFLQGAAVFIGPPLAGKLVDYLDGDYAVTFILFGILMALSGVILLFVPFIDFIRWKQAFPRGTC